MLQTGDRDAALQLAAKGKEHAQLAKEARQAANQAAFESSNLHVTNRFKVRLLDTHACTYQLLSMFLTLLAQLENPDIFRSCWKGKTCPSQCS